MKSLNEQYQEHMKSLDALLSATEQIPEFHVDDSDDLHQVAQAANAAIKKDEDDLAVRMAARAVQLLSGKLGSFLRHSIIPKRGVDPSTPRFVRMLNSLVEQNYDLDKVDSLRKMMQEYEAVFAVETNGTFEKRIEGYNNLLAAFNDIRTKQRQLDEKRQRENFLDKKGTLDENSPTVRRQRNLAARKAAVEVSEGVLSRLAARSRR
ncbi:MAG: hypothetical protein KW793_00555 [Candidatus Doudnabacteria bacterium]|nr:hypothetical protein [Candidatus Doudnabacteria bacterium]